MADDPKPEPAKDDPKPEPSPDPELGDAGKKALAAERDARKKAEKEAKELSERLQAIEDKDKSDLDKANDKLAKAEQRAAEAEQRALRLEVAQAKGLTPAQAKFLTGATQEEFEASADELLATFAPAEPSSEGEPSGTSRRPKEALTPGASNADDGDDVDIQAVVDAIPRGI